MKKILVIVVTYNGMQWLERCLSSVMPGTTGDLQTDLYVLDNDSTDGSADFVQAHFPKAKVVRSAENLGFSKANNLGFRYALDKGYDYVYLLNQDAWLEEGALETLVAAAEEDSQYGVLSPLQMTDGFKELDRLFKKDKTPPAAHWLVPVGALQKVGLFEEDLFPLYGQDDDWCNRASYHGWKIGVIPEARGVHDRAQRAEAKEKIIHRNYYSGSLVRLCDINRPLWERFCYVCLFTLVKTVKYRSVLVFKYFLQICKQLPMVREHRRNSR